MSALGSVLGQETTLELITKISYHDYIVIIETTQIQLTRIPNMESDQVRSHSKIIFFW